MKVELKPGQKADEQPQEQDELPGAADGHVEQPVTDEPVEDQPNDGEDRFRKLELENAELRGEKRALESIRSAGTGADNAKAAENQWKSQVLADMNGLPDEDFKAKYRFEKYQATAAILEHDFQKSDSKNKQEIAELRAENRLTAKYGKDFAALRQEVDEMVAMAAPEVRQDPAKLEKLMEKAYLAASKNRGPQPQPKPQPKKEDGVRKIVSMEKPTPAPQGGRAPEKNDELPAEIRSLGKAFRLNSEKERQDLLKDPYVPMDLGAGLVFRDPEKGVEQKA